MPYVVFGGIMLMVVLIVAVLFPFFFVWGQTLFK